MNLIGNSAARVGVRPRLEVRAAQLPALAVAAILLWLPLHTPIAVVAYQYAESINLARAVLLSKDVAVLSMILLLLVGNYRRIHLRRFEYAAIAYAALIAAYSLVPWIAGSQLPFMSVAASARILLVPVELYALGRLAVGAGVGLEHTIRWFVGLSAVFAVVSLLAYAVLPPTVWETNFNLVGFVREVQGIPTATSLWGISVLGHYGIGDTGLFPRAVAPFTHPVGTGHYFVLPLVLSVAAAYASLNAGRKRQAILLATLAVLFALAVVGPISRGSWIAAGIAVLVCGVLYRRIVVSVVALTLTGLVLVATPPFSYSILSALSLADSSVVGHQEAVGKGLDTVGENPIGLGVGQADQFGQAYSGGGTEAAAGIGENMYLSLLVSVGPLGAAAFLVWVGGIARRLVVTRRAVGAPWYVVGTGAALIGYLASAMTSSSLMRFTTSGSFWLIAGLVVAGLAWSRIAPGSPAAADPS